MNKEFTARYSVQKTRIGPDMADLQNITLQNFDIKITSDGRWFHEGGEIKRMGLVKLFASVLSCDDDGRYWLTTPVEKGEISVEDAPFVIVAMQVEGKSDKQMITFIDNLGETHLLSSQKPLEMRPQPNSDAKPYLKLEKGLSALIKHAVFYELAELALQGGLTSKTGQIEVRSDGAVFSLEG